MQILVRCFFDTLDIRGSYSMKKPVSAVKRMVVGIFEIPLIAAISLQSTWPRILGFVHHESVNTVLKSQIAVQPTLLILPSTAEKYQLPIEVGAVKMDG